MNIDIQPLTVASCRGRMQRLSRTNRQLVLICLACFAWAFSFGLECPISSLWLEKSGYSTKFIGYNTATHFLGVILGGLIVTQFIYWVPRISIAVGLLLSGFGCVVFPFCEETISFIARFIAGFGGAFAMVVLESYVNINAKPERRARDFAFYAIAIGLGFAFGVRTGLDIFASSPHLAFGFGMVAILGLVPLAFLDPIQIPKEKNSELELTFHAPFLSIGSAWTQGFLEAAMLSLLPIYLAHLGMHDQEIGYLLSAILVGVILFQFPIGWLADRFGREQILVACFICTAALMAIIPWCPKGPGVRVLLFFVGICSGAFYPLGLALLGEKLPKIDIPKANAWYLGINSLGCLVSPVIFGECMSKFGRRAMFWTADIVILIILTMWVFVRLSKRGSQKIDTGSNAETSPSNNSDQRAA